MKKTYRWITALASMVLMLGLGSASVAQAQSNQWVTIVNNSSQPVYKIFFSSPDRTGWGPDRLGRNVLLDGYEQRFDVRDGAGTCAMDIKAVMRNGAEHTVMDVNTCRLLRLRLYDGSQNYRLEYP